MNALLRTTAVALVVALLTLGVFGPRFACSPGDYQTLLQEIRRHEELQELEQTTSRREEAIRQATHDYIAQRCTLAETMQRVRELEREVDQEWPYLSSARKMSPLSDEERHYGVIISYVQTILYGRSGELATVLRRLEKDYQQLQTGRQAPSPAATERTEQSR
jgi:hypothetical protein